jgi:shikimate dehydrogenase
MKTAGIIGHPVAHSLSPVFQSAAFAARGLDVRYELWDTPPGTLAGRVASLHNDAVIGANVTVPHKEAVIPLLDDLDEQAAPVGAVNTIVNRAGRLTGYNTDGPGFLRALAAEAGFDCRGRSVLILGAGGAARGIAFAVAASGAAEVAVLNRSAARAERLVADVARAGFAARALPPGQSLARYDCIVNCTSVGMHGGPDPAGIPINVAALAPGALVVDIVYAPEQTPLLRAAAGRGIRSLPGLPMLIYQGALAFELWTGIEAPVDVMFAAARKALRLREA